MEDWTDLLASLMGGMTQEDMKKISREDVEAIGLIIEMAERDYENHQKKEKKNES